MVYKQDAGNWANVAAPAALDDNSWPALKLAIFCGRNIKPEVGADVSDIPEVAIEIEAKLYAHDAGRRRPTTALVSPAQLANYAN